MLALLTTMFIALRVAILSYNLFTAGKTSQTDILLAVHSISLQWLSYCQIAVAFGTWCVGLTQKFIQIQYKVKF